MLKYDECHFPRNSLNPQSGYNNLILNNIFSISVATDRGVTSPRQMYPRGD